jgi:hypothetical protein
MVCPAAVGRARPGMRASNKGLAEVDIIRISFWMFYKEWPLAKRFIDGEVLPTRLKANSERAWTISVLDAVAYRSQVQEIAESERRYLFKFFLLSILHYTSYLYPWIPSMRTMLPPTLLVQLGNGQVVKKTVWRAALALTRTTEITDYALRSKPAIK